MRHRLSGGGIVAENKSHFTKEQIDAIFKQADDAVREAQELVKPRTKENVFYGNNRSETGSGMTDEEIDELVSFLEEDEKTSLEKSEDVSIPQMKKAKKAPVRNSDKINTENKAAVSKSTENKATVSKSTENKAAVSKSAEKIKSVDKEEDIFQEEADNITTNTPSKKASKKEPKKKSKAFLISLIAYTVVLIILSILFLSYTDKCLKKYENSQAYKAMEKYGEEVQQMLHNGTLADKVTIDTNAIFEDETVYREAYRQTLFGKSTITYEKDPASYDTQAPVYDIFADGTLVAKLNLEATNEHTIFGILTVVDWDIASIVPVFSVDVKNYSISVPEGYKVSVNGIELTADNMVGTPELPAEFMNAAEYCEMPKRVNYEAKGLINAPEIIVTDSAGVQQVCEADETGNVYVDFSNSDEMPEDIKQQSLDMAMCWENFMTNDLPGASHGLGTVQQYLIKDSYYWNMAKDYAYGVDITFISDHVISNPPYSNVVADEYRSYGPNAYSCHIAFEKNMLLAGGSPYVSKFDSTIYFVYYDDSDDGVDNPHWAIVDMISTTN